MLTWLGIVLLAILGTWLVVRRLRRGDTPPAERSTELVTAEAAARRALCLGVVVQRGRGEAAAHLGPPLPIEEALRDAFTDEKRKENEKLTAWLRAEGLWNSLSGQELDALKRDFGTWSEQEYKNALWRGEALHMILWALRRIAFIPPYDQETEPEVLMLRLGLGQPAAIFVRDAALRPEAEIRQARDRAELWLWRARTHYLQNSPEAPKPPADLGLTFEEIISMSTTAAVQDGVFEAIAGDFPVFGKPYRSVTEDEHSLLTSIATERLYALNWLCGYEADWDSIPTDT